MCSNYYLPAGPLVAWSTFWSLSDWTHEARHWEAEERHDYHLSHVPSIGWRHYGVFFKKSTHMYLLLLKLLDAYLVPAKCAAQCLARLNGMSQRMNKALWVLVWSEYEVQMRVFVWATYTVYGITCLFKNICKQEPGPSSYLQFQFIFEFTLFVGGE